MTREQVKKKIRNEFYKKNWSPVRVRDLIDQHLNDSQRVYYDVLELVSEVTNIDKDAILSRTRKREYVIARQLAAYFLVRHQGYGLVMAGKEINLDHSTIIYHLRQIENALDVNDPMIVKPVTAIKEKISKLAKR